MLVAGACVPVDGGVLPEAGIVELLELFRVMDRVELALVVDVRFSGWVLVFCDSTGEVAVELVV